MLLSPPELVLGLVEICFDVGSIGLGLPEPALIVVVMVQIFETVLTCVDFFVATTDAQTESESLFDAKSTSETKEEWCTSMVTNSTSCIAKKRGMTGTGSLSAGVTMQVSWLVIVVLSITTYWMVSENTHRRRQR